MAWHLPSLRPLRLGPRSLAARPRPDPEQLLEGGAATASLLPGTARAPRVAAAGSTGRAKPWRPWR